MSRQTKPYENGKGRHRNPYYSKEPTLRSKSGVNQTRDGQQKNKIFFSFIKEIFSIKLICF